MSIWMIFLLGMLILLRMLFHPLVQYSANVIAKLKSGPKNVDFLNMISSLCSLNRLHF